MEKFVSEICKSRALQEHVPLITQSSSVTEPTHTPVARQAQMAALLNWQQMRPHAKFQNPLQLCSAPGDFPVDRADLMCRTRKPAAIRAQLHPRARARSQADCLVALTELRIQQSGLCMHTKPHTRTPKMLLHVHWQEGQYRASLALSAHKAK